MNKLILIGNGFDLAHDLPTSYQHFLNDFWKNIHLNYKKESYKNLVYINENYYKILNYKIQAENFKDFQQNLVFYQNEYSNEIEPYRGQLNLRKGNLIIFKFKNDFFHQINSKNSIENWVDIENEYYLELKKIVKSLDIESDKKNLLLKLNNEFEEIKTLLKDYLIQKVNNTFNFKDIESTIELEKQLKILESNNFFQKNLDKTLILNYSKEFSDQKDIDQILKISEDLRTNQSIKNITFDTLFLDFNYTSTVPFYKRILNQREAGYFINKIHGDLNKPIFGFGDEIDSSYKEIEDIGDNEYLKNFKSFQYSNTQNYDDLLRYIDSDKFQVCILGHSCGLSDRVLLNTIFEHENCRSIKVYYYEKEKGADNYTDIIQNISRHFNDKASMRRKIVNKELCSPLPQNVRFQKK